MAYRFIKAFLLTVGVGVVTSNAAEMSFPHFSSNDRVLVFAPHPDDEILGTGGVIQQALAAKADVHICFFTMGDNYEWAFLAYRKRPVLKPEEMQQMGELRRREAIAAAARLGLPPDRLTFLGYPDWGTLAIWTGHWGDAPPLRSMLTRVTAVPYKEALRPGAFYRGQDIVRDLETVLQNVKPTQIFVSHPGDAHRDHRSLYLYLKIALWNLHWQIPVHAFIIHFKNWPRPWGLFPTQPLEPPTAVQDQGQWRSVALTSREQAVKEVALREHKTQFQFDHLFLSSFLRPNEIFDDIPEIILKRNQGSRDISSSQAQAKMALPQEMPETVQEQFIGIDWHTLERIDDDLVFTLRLSRGFVGRTTASIYAFGWRNGTAFSGMPKLQVHIGVVGYSVWDGRKRLPNQSVVVSHQGTAWTLRIPLTLLDSPEALLIGARTSTGKDLEEAPRGNDHPSHTLDWTTWHAVQLPN
jgi:LmbE family N-acetylglucosaminyl deacetylase